jgi:hypothetical protein
MAKEINISDKKGKKSKKKEKTPKQTSQDIKPEQRDPALQTQPVNPDKEEKKGKKEKMSKPEKKEKRNIDKKKLWISLGISAVLLLVGIGAFYYFGIYKAHPYKKPSEVLNLTHGYIVPAKKYERFVEISTIQPTEPKTEESVLNGLLFTKTEMKELVTRRPVAVMINNHAVARPQSGLNSADIVYEVLVESGITRYMGIFWSEAPKKVGPIRSARQYYLEWLSPYDPLYIYDGCAKTTDVRTNACGNIYTYDIKNIATIGAWRWNDGTRYAPHNEYSSVTNAWEYAEKKNWDSMPKIDQWDFKSDAHSEDRGEKTVVKISFHKSLTNSGLYDATWTYDQKSNSYFKKTGNKIDIDQETNAQVYTKNIVVQETAITSAVDNKGRIIVKTIGSGKATYLIDGKITTGEWEKASRTDRTMFYDSEGNEIQFNRGRIWITVISPSLGKFAIIEQ